MSDNQTSPEYEDFIKDWDVKTDDYAATHKSGLEVNLSIDRGDHIECEYPGYLLWRKRMYQNGLSDKQISDKFIELNRQFEVIYRKLEARQSSPTPSLATQKAIIDSKVESH